MAKIVITLNDVAVNESDTRIHVQANFDPPIPADHEPDRVMSTAEIVAFKMLDILSEGATQVHADATVEGESN